MKRLLTAFFALASLSVSAQTLFYYGDDSVSSQEFLKAYNKNNTGVRSEKAMRDYLDLYIASRLKVREARDEGYDTLPQIVADIQSLRRQILPAYINDKKTMDKLVNEAFTRSQKNVHIAHIFIGNSADIERKKETVLNALKNTAFAAVAKKYSDDPSARDNGGDLGWIAVFSLPYELENLAYATPVGKYKVHRSKAGYHIFKNLGERRDVGRIKAAQILLAFPPGADETAKSRIKKLADSLYNRLLKGDDFSRLATEFSNDIVSAASNGQMQEFGAGQYEPAFENNAFALAKDGAISKPFLTSYGYHIVKRIAKTPVSSARNEKTMETLKARVQQSDRMQTVKAALAQQVRMQTEYRKLKAAEGNELFLYSDSILNGKQNGISYTLDQQTPLLSFGNDKYTVTDWIGFARSNRYRQDGKGLKSYPELWEGFVDAMSIRYYEDHLEDFNEEFRHQLAEFSEGNLFFEVMQRKIWGPAQSDSAALESYFKKNQSAYFWKHSAEAVVFYATDGASARTFINELRKNPAKWQELVASFSEKIAADSSRVELADVPNPTKLALKAGTITDPLVNKMDNTASFAYIVHVYNKPEPRSFSEARGLVINDYQQQLEQEWLARLKQKYPVRINQKELNKLISQKKY